MVVGTSAVVAIGLHEYGYEELIEKLANAETRSMSAVSYMEAAMVLITRRGDDAERRLDMLIADALIMIVPVTAVHARIARAAFRRYGKGGDKAALNFGDCFTYALARQTGDALLFVGNDFNWTDLPIA